jgi:hypothetical protein
VSVSELGGEIDRQLTIYSERINEGIRQEAENSLKALIKETKATAPVGNRQKHYRDSISGKYIRNRWNTKAIWYVKGSDYRLSHLLENGHAKRGGGRVEGTHFIQKATDPILEQYLKAVEEVIKNG